MWDTACAHLCLIWTLHVQTSASSGVGGTLHVHTSASSGVGGCGTRHVHTSASSQAHSRCVYQVKHVIFVDVWMCRGAGDLETLRHVHANIVAASCMSIGLRYAGSAGPTFTCFT